MNQELISLQRQAILLAIRDGSTKEKWLTAVEIANALGMSPLIVNRRLRSLSKEGKIYHSVHRKRNSTGRTCKYFRWQLMPDVRRNLEQGVK